LYVILIFLGKISPFGIALLDDKVDLVMWAKNGARMLPAVLKRIEEVIPDDEVDKKIFVDDHSLDETPLIAKDFGWSVYLNKKGGVGSGANLALQHVTRKYFVSFEQDVILAMEWWEKIPKYMERREVAVAQGWRISNHPVIGKIDEYSMERFRSSLFSIDNTIYKTEVIRDLGGFPEHLKYTGVDAYVHQRVLNAGLKWVTDSSVISVHLRKGGLLEQIKRYYHYGMDMPVLAQEELFIKAGVTSRLTRSALIALFSPFRSLEIAIKKKCPQALYYYPIIRFSHLAGCLKRAGS
jgi:GT2 family glycosyltransferase